MKFAAALLALALAACAAQPIARMPPEQLHADPARLILITINNPLEPVSSHAGSTPRGYDGIGRYAVGDQARATLAALERDYDLSPVAAWPIAPLHVHCAVLAIPAQASRAAVLARLAGDPRVSLAQPLQEFGTLGAAYNDPYFNLQRGFAEIDAAGAQQWSRGQGVRVAVIDTGMDAAHPDLQGRVLLQRNFVDADQRQFGADLHGTEVAGIIAADANNAEGIVGVAPGARILAFKACWQTGVGAACNSFTLAQALTSAIESGAQVLNLSLGGPADPVLGQLLVYALAHGLIVIGAVPPDGRVDGFPLGVPGVIGVDVAGHGKAPSSSLRAPGREVLTLTPGGHYDFASGSSLAAAHVSGTVALLLEQEPRLDAQHAYALLSRSSAPGDAINACAALAALHPAAQSCTAPTAMAGAP